MATVLDYSASVPASNLIKEAGHIGTVRYISPARAAWMQGKPIKKQELDEHRKHGLRTAYVWQYGAGSAETSDVMRGASGGRADAQQAERVLSEIGAAGAPVFFAVDFNITLDQWNSTAVHYFRSACDVLGRQRVGIYGHSRVIAWAMEDDVVAHVGEGRVLGWQTPAWSHGVIAREYAVLYQGASNVEFHGTSVDVNEVLHEEWGWRPLPTDTAPAVPTPTPPPVTTNSDGVREVAGIKITTPRQDRSKPWKAMSGDMLTWRDSGISRLQRVAVIIHSDESNLRNPGGPAYSAERLAQYNIEAPDDERRGSYHIGVDQQGRDVRQNDDPYATWSVGNVGNFLCLHICLTGTAHQTRDQWLRYPAQLEKAAAIIAHWLHLHNIPLRRTNPKDLASRDIRRGGIGGHWDCTWAWSGGSGHWDPGGYPMSDLNGTGRPTDGGFPWDIMLELVAAHYHPDPEKEPSVFAKPIRSLINQTKQFWADALLAIIDATAWENHKMLEELLRRQGTDPDKFLEDARRRDNETK